MHDNINFEIAEKQGYEEETTTWNKLYNKIVEKALDKQFAVKYAFGLFYIAYGFNNTGMLSKRVTVHNDTCLKLGYPLSIIIPSIVNVINEYKKEASLYWKKNRKKIRKIKLSFQKNNWGLPLVWKPLKVDIKQKHTPYFIAGPFFTIKEPIEIARELGKTKAREDFLRFLKDRYKRFGGDIQDLLPVPKTVKNSKHHLIDCLNNEDVESFIAFLRSILASIPYQLAEYEANYHSLVHAIIVCAGIQIVSEYATNTGRIDAVIETENRIYILEFKLDSSGALSQILQKKYYESFLNKGKRVILVGIHFCSKMRNIKEWNLQIINKATE